MSDHLLTPEQRRVRDDAREYRDIRLASIWTGTNEIKASIIAHEWYREAASQKGRDYAADAPEAEAADEIIYG